MVEANTRVVHENLDTSYVNLAALVRYLQQRDFVGRIHVQLVEYEADVYLNAREPPRVHERDLATGRAGEGDSALKRLLVRAIEAGGLVSVYAGEEAPGNGAAGSGEASDDNGETELDIVDEEWRDLLQVSGAVIAAVERAALSAGADFYALLNAARLELSEDYSFLDPLTERFEYASGGTVRLHSRPATTAYISSVCECLRRVVAAMATGARAASVRERVALELAVLARRRQSQLARFKFIQQFERIAGARVL